MSQARDRARSFTLIEVLIAVFVLAVGVIGVAALIPTALNSAADTSDALVAAEHARSVVASLRLAAAEHAYATWRDEAGARVLERSFLIFPHPAALDSADGPPRAWLPGGALDPEVFSSRACVLLPQGSEKTFVYPRPGEPTDIARENGQGLVADARDDVADREADEPLVRATYQLEGPAGVLSPPYGFAFALTRARVAGEPVEGLYSLTVFIYKGFVPYVPGEGAEDPAPIAVYCTELKAGPMQLETLGGGG